MSGASNSAAMWNGHPAPPSSVAKNQRGRATSRPSREGRRPCSRGTSRASRAWRATARSNRIEATQAHATPSSRRYMGGRHHRRCACASSSQPASPSTRCPPPRRWFRVSAGRSGSRWGSTPNTGVALTFDDGPHPEGTAAALEILAQGVGAGHLLPRRRAGGALPGARRRDRGHGTRGRAALPPSSQPASLDAGAIVDDMRRGEAAIARRAGGRRASTDRRTGSSAPPGWRSRGAATDSCSGPAGDGTGPAQATAESIARGQPGTSGRRRDPAARGGPLQRPGVLAADGRARCRESSRAWRAAGHAPVAINDGGS